MLAADISGSWAFTVETAQGGGTAIFEFKQDGEKLTGTYSGRFGKAPVAGTVKGDKVEFTFEVPNLDGEVRYKGKLDSPTTMKGEVEYGDADGTFTAKKK
jgi:hypothetical protein